jgi:tetratricopeptide (TPR) repeat protein
MPPNTPDAPTHLLRRALEYRQARQYPQAADMLEEYLRLRPNNADAHAQLAVIRWTMNQFDLALPHCGDGNDRIDPGDGLDFGCGGSGNDFFVIYNDGDTLDGGDGTDSLSGTDTGDVIFNIP